MSSANGSLLTSSRSWPDLRLLYETSPQGDGPIRISCDLGGHQDDSPSLCVYRDHSYCYGCHTWEGYHQHLERRGVSWRKLEDAETAPLGHLVVKGTARSHTVTARRMDDQELHDLASWYHRKGQAEGAASWFAARGLGQEIVDEVLLGWTGRAYTIPIWRDRPTVTGSLQTIRFRHASTPQKGESKYWGMVGRNDAYLYAPRGFARKVVLTEGEFDCLVACQAGYTACTITNGVGSMDYGPYADQLAPVEDVVLALDQDGAGTSQAIQVAKSLRALGKKVRYARWWEKDVTDLYLKSGTSGLRQALGEV